MTTSKSSGYGEKVVVIESGYDSVLDSVCRFPKGVTRLVLDYAQNSVRVSWNIGRFDWCGDMTVGRVATFAEKTVMLPSPDCGWFMNASENGQVTVKERWANAKEQRLLSPVVDTQGHTVDPYQLSRGMKAKTTVDGTVATPVTWGAARSVMSEWKAPVAPVIDQPVRIVCLRSPEASSQKLIFVYHAMLSVVVKELDAVAEVYRTFSFWSRPFCVPRFRAFPVTALIGQSNACEFCGGRIGFTAYCCKRCARAKCCSSACRTSYWFAHHMYECKASV